uniref:Secreted protein n=2 Tax=Cacopsylla melanoneura TaxID=428564 RepID=A0A8D8VNQ0_9HEMI
MMRLVLLLTTVAMVTALSTLESSARYAVPVVETGPGYAERHEIVSGVNYPVAGNGYNSLAQGSVLNGAVIRRPGYNGVVQGPGYNGLHGSTYVRPDPYYGDHGLIDSALHHPYDSHYVDHIHTDDLHRPYDTYPRGPIIDTHRVEDLHRPLYDRVGQRPAN